MNTDTKNFDAVFACPFGGIGIHLRDLCIVELEFLYQPVNKNYFASEQAERIAADILLYFTNPQHDFESELLAKGTAFQKRVWDQLCRIPVGEVRTYGEVAATLNSSARAVGNACRKNPLPLMVPCHRVVAKNGLGGFAGEREGQTISLKKWLLDFEASSV